MTPTEPRRGATTRRRGRMIVAIAAAALTSPPGVVAAGQPTANEHRTTVAATGSRTLVRPDRPPVRVATVTSSRSAVVSWSGPGAGHASLPDATLAAYERAAVVLNAVAPRCHLHWSLLAGIGALTPTGSASRNQGAPVGPLALPRPLWLLLRVDADGDGRRDPRDVDDAAMATAVLLCASARNLTDPADRHRALLALGHGPTYAARVLALARRFRLQTPAAGPPPARPATVTLGAQVETPAAARPRTHPVRGAGAAATGARPTALAEPRPTPAEPVVVVPATPSTDQTPEHPRESAGAPGRNDPTPPAPTGTPEPSLPDPTTPPTCPLSPAPTGQPAGGTTPSSETPEVGEQAGFIDAPQTEPAQPGGPGENDACDLPGPALRSATACAPVC